MPQSRQERSFLRDIAFVEGDFGATASGDLAIAEGFTNLRQAFYNRMITLAGTLLHRPQYGAGLPSLQNEIMSVSRRQQIANQMEENLLRDGRFGEIVSVTFDENQPDDTLVLTVTYRPAGGGEEITDIRIN